MPNEVNALIPQDPSETDAFEPKTVAKSRFVATYHRNAYGQSDLVAERQVA